MNGYISGSFRLQTAFPSIHCATKETLPSDDLISHSCQYESVFFSLGCQSLVIKTQSHQAETTV